MMRVLFLYCFTSKQFATMADAVIADVLGTGAEVYVRRISEPVPPNVAAVSHFKIG